MLVDHIISEICNLKIKKIILIGNNTTLLNYKHWFMDSPHAMNSRS